MTEQAKVPPARAGMVAIAHPSVPGAWKLVRAEDFGPPMRRWEGVTRAVQEEREEEEVTVTARRGRRGTRRA